MDDYCWLCLLAITIPAILINSLLPFSSKLKSCISFWLHVEYLIVGNVYITLKVQHLADIHKLPFRSYDDFVSKVSSGEAYYATTTSRRGFVASALFAELYPSLAAALRTKPPLFPAEEREELFRTIAADPRLGFIASDASFYEYQAHSCTLNAFSVPGASRTWLVIPLRKRARIAKALNRALYRNGMSAVDLYTNLKRSFDVDTCSYRRKGINPLRVLDILPALTFLGLFLIPSAAGLFVEIAISKLDLWFSHFHANVFLNRERLYLTPLEQLRGIVYEIAFFN